MSEESGALMAQHDTFLLVRRTPQLLLLLTTDMLSNNRKNAQRRNGSTQEYSENEIQQMKEVAEKQLGVILELRRTEYEERKRAASFKVQADEYLKKEKRSESLAKESEMQWNTKLEEALGGDDDVSGMKRSILLDRDPHYKTTLEEVKACRVTIAYNASLHSVSERTTVEARKNHVNIVKPAVDSVLAAAKLGLVRAGEKMEVNRPPPDSFYLNIFGLKNVGMQYSPDMTYTELCRRVNLAVISYKERMNNRKEGRSMQLKEEDGLAWWNAPKDNSDIDMSDESDENDKTEPIGHESTQSDDQRDRNSLSSVRAETTTVTTIRAVTRSTTVIRAESQNSDKQDEEKTGSGVHEPPPPFPVESPPPVNDPNGNSTTYQPSTEDMMSILNDPIGGFGQHLLAKLGDKKIDEVFLNDPILKPLVEAVYAAHPDIEEYTVHTEDPITTDHGNYQKCKPGDAVASAVAVHRIFSARMQNCLRREVFFEITAEPYPKKNSARTIRVVLRDKGSDSAYIFFGNFDSPEFAIPAIYSPKPIMKFAFAVDDFFRDTLIEFLREQTDKFGRHWEVPPLRKDNCCVIAIGDGFGTHTDGQYNLYSEQHDDVPSKTSEIVVNTLNIALIHKNQYGVIGVPNGSLSLGSLPGDGDNSFCVNDTLATYESTMSSQLIGAMSGRNRHAAIQNKPFYRASLSFRAVILGKEATLSRFQGRLKAKKEVEQADLHKKKWHEFAQSPWNILNSNGMKLSPSYTSSTATAKANTFPLPKLEKGYFHKPRAYNRAAKEIELPGNARDVLSLPGLVAYVIGKGFCGFSHLVNDADLPCIFGVPVYNGQIVRIGESVPANVVDMFHHNNANVKRGNSVWSQSLEFPMTSMSLIQAYKSSKRVLEQKCEDIFGPDGTLFTHGSGGSGRKATQFGSTNKGGASWIACQPQDPTSALNTNLILNSRHGGILALYRATGHTDCSKSFDSSSRQYAGLAFVKELVIGHPDKKKKDLIQMRHKESEDWLENTTYLEQRVISVVLQRLPYDEETLIQMSKTRGGPKYVNFDGNALNNDMFSKTVTTSDFKAAKAPVYDPVSQKLDRSGMVTPQKSALQRIQATKIEQFAHPYNARGVAVWDGLTDHVRQADAESQGAIHNEDMGENEEEELSDDITDLSDKETNDDSDRPIAPLILSMCNESMRLARAADARALGHGQEVVNGRLMPMTLTGEKFGMLGAAARLHAMSHPNRMDNVTTQRYTRCIRARFPIPESQCKGTTQYRAQRLYRHREWAMEDIDGVVDRFHSAFVNQFLPNPCLWQKWVKHSHPSLDESEENFWAKCCICVEDSSKFIEFIERLLSDEGGYAVSQLRSGQYNLPYTEPQDLFIFLPLLPKLIKDTYQSCMNVQDDSDVRTQFINDISAALLDAGVGEGNSKCNTWRFPVSQGVSDVDEVTDFLLGRPRATGQICGSGSRQAITIIRAQLKEMECGSRFQKKKWTIPQVLDEVHRSQVKIACENSVFRNVHGIVLENDKPVFDANGRPLCITEAEQGACDTLTRPMSKTTPGGITETPNGASFHTHPNFCAGAHALSNEDSASARRRFDSVSVIPACINQMRNDFNIVQPGDCNVKIVVAGGPAVLPDPEKIFCLPEEDINKHEDAFASCDEDSEMTRSSNRTKWERSNAEKQSTTVKQKSSLSTAKQKKTKSKSGSRKRIQNDSAFHEYHGYSQPDTLQRRLSRPSHHDNTWSYADVADEDADRQMEWDDKKEDQDFDSEKESDEYESHS